MEREANYVAVGAFTLLVIAMAVSFVIWYSDTGDSRIYTPYEIYMSGSVAGLTIGSPVRYLGVDVGTVRRITLDKQHPEVVKILASVDAEAPITGATRASLGLQGITGLLYINLKQITDASSSELKQGENYPVIEAQSSDIDAFIASLPQLTTRVASLIDNMNKIFSDDNINALSTTLTNLKITSAELPETHQQVQNLLIELDNTTAEIKKTATSIGQLSNEIRPELKQSLSRLNTASEQLVSTTSRIDRFLAASEEPMNHFTEQGLFELEGLLTEARYAASEFRELSRTLKETPSQLLFERPESGVEIKP